MIPPITELGIVLITATVLALLARSFRQPPLLGYILTGFILGPIGARFIVSRDLLNTFSEIGIALLLFLVGLELNWSHLKRIGRAAINLAILQITLTFALGYAVGLGFGFSPTAATVIGFTLSFSSTIVVLQLIAAKNDVQSLYGKLAVSLLIIQDIVAVIVLVLLTSFGQGNVTNILADLMSLAGKLVLLFGIAWVASRFFLPRLFHSLARSRDLMVTAALAWCFAVAIAASGLGFSFAVGAFIAGLSLAALPYNLDIFGQIRPLRDFFIVIFFVLLGFSFTPQGSVNWSLVAVLVALAVLAKPFIILISLTAQRFRARTSFFSAASLGQMSEFSVILALAAAGQGLIDNNILGAITIATAITFAISSYVVGAADRLYFFARPFASRLQIKGKSFYLESTPEVTDHVIIFGYHRMGFHILKTLRKLKQEALVVDFNPEVIEQLRDHDIPSVFGDAADPDLLETIHLKNARIVISTIPHLEENLTLIKKIRAIHKKIIMIATAEEVDDALTFYQAGADYVIIPKLLSGEHVADLLEQYTTGTLRHHLDQHHGDAKLLRTKNHDLYL